MNAHASYRRAGRSPRLLLPFALLLAALPPVPAAWSQVATTLPDVGGLERLALARTGTFEVWQDTTRLGTEFYRVYSTPKGDSLLAISTVRYELRGQGGLTAYEKWTLGITRGLDAFPLLFQSREGIGGRQRVLNLTFPDGNAIIFRESEGSGQANVVGVPPGRLYILDPNVYEHIETLVSDFCERGLATRLQNVIMTPRDTVLQVRLTRGPQESIEGPGRGKRKATRVDVSDDLTLIKTWLDEQGLLLRLEAPAQKLRVVRLPPGKAEAEAAAGAAKGSAPAKGAAAPRP
jgi:hypothetical protein